MSEFETILYAVEGPVATITLNRPERLNTIVPPMPDEVQEAVALAVRDDEVKVKKGKHVFKVRAVVGGTPDPTPATYKFKRKKPKR